MPFNERLSRSRTRCKREGREGKLAQASQRVRRLDIITVHWRFARSRARLLSNSNSVKNVARFLKVGFARLRGQRRRRRRLRSVANHDEARSRHRSSSETTTTTIISSATPPSPPPPQPKHPYSLRLLTRERTDGRTNERRIIGGPVSDDAETETAPQSDRFSFPLAKEQNCPPTPNRQFCKELCVNCALKTIDVKRASRSLLSAGTNYSRLRSVADHCGSLGSIEPG